MKTEEFIIEQYSREDSLESYKDITLKGLWKEEETTFSRYIRDTDIVLDLGCGTGRASFNIKKYKELYACDVVPAMIETANKIAPQFKNKPIFSIQDGRSLDYPYSFFDVVIFAYNGINTVPGKLNRLKIISEANRVLKDSGILIFATHIRNFRRRPIHWAKRFIQSYLKNTEHIKEYGDNINFKYGRPQYINIPSTKETLNILEKAGFRVIEKIKTESNSTDEKRTHAPRGTEIFVCKKI